MRRSVILDTSVRLLFPSALVFALYLLFAGHNQPGGGFAGGLVAGAAVVLRYVAGGIDEVRGLLRVAPWTVLGTGLAVATVTALVPLALGEPILSSHAWEAEVALLGKVKLTSPLFFDIGVFLVVVGLVLMALEAFGETPEPAEEDPA